MKRINLVLLLMFCICQAYSQSIDLYFPNFANQEWYWTTFSGNKRDTIATGKLDETGRVKLKLPNGNNSYRGMTQWLLTNGGGLTMIVSGGEKFSVICTEEQPTEDNIFYEGTSENIYLNNRYKRQMNILDKMDAMRMSIDAYKNDTSLFPVFNAELQKLQEAYSLLQSETQSNPLYAARFAEIVDLTRGLSQEITPDQSENERLMKDFIINEMDIEVLYTSGHWDNVLNQWLSWYEYAPKDHLPSFVTDAKQLLNRTSSDEVYTVLAEQMISACEEQNWHDQEIELALFLLNDDRIKQPTKKIKSIYTLLKVRKGSKAPTITQGKLVNKKTIIVFYDSGCGNCVLEMSKLAKQYPELKRKGYKIISISADNDRGLFETHASELPWEDKYCDFKGFAGEDFLNYGVMGTPTFYVLDSKKVIQGRYARVEDIEI